MWKPIISAKVMGYARFLKKWGHTRDLEAVQSTIRDVIADPCAFDGRPPFDESAYRRRCGGAPHLSVIYAIDETEGVVYIDSVMNVRM